MLRQLITTVLTTLALQAFAAVDVNQANQADLESIRGIGPGLSTRILDARKSASFKDWGDFVERVRGVGPGNAARLSQAGLTVSGQAYAANASAATPAAKTRKSGDKAMR